MDVEGFGRLNDTTSQPNSYQLGHAIAKLSRASLPSQVVSEY